MDYRKQVESIVDYIQSGQVAEEKFGIGVEMEHFIVDKDTGETVSYYGPGGVGESLDEIGDLLGFEKEIEDGYTLGLHKDTIDIATEPGAQFEIAIRYDPCIRNLEDEYRCLMKKIIPIFEKKNQFLVTLGYHPVTKIDDIKILPKKRYDHMYRYFKERGTMAHNMMKGTASLQVTVDYSSEEDWKRKFRILNGLSPVFYALFDNSYLFEGQPSPIRNIREKIWENTDKDRSGVYPFAFDQDLSYEKYAEHILNTPMIFSDIQGQQDYVGASLLKDLLTEENKDEMIFHGLSIVFPDVRVKNYIEIRMMDAMPYPYNFACLALIKGLMYKEENLKELEEMMVDLDYETMMAAKEGVMKKGIQQEYLGMTIRDLGLKLIAMAKKQMPFEKRYLIYLQDLLEENQTLRDLFEETMKEEGLLKAIERNALTEEKLEC